MNTTIRNIILIAAIAVVVIGVTVAVVLLQRPSEADEINQQLALMSNPTAEADNDEPDEAVTTAQREHTSDEPIVIDEETVDAPVETAEIDDSVEVLPPANDTPTQTTVTTKPAVTVVTTAPAVTTPPSTVRTDRPVVTTTPPVTTTTAADDEPEVIDDWDLPTPTTPEGFPENPQPSQHYIDEDGQEWTYNAIFGWGEYSPAVQYEFPDFELSGKIILS